MTGLQLEFPLMLRPQVKLRSEIESWATANGVDLEPAVYGKPAKLSSSSGTFVTRQQRRQRFMKILKSVGQFLVSKRPFDGQIC